MKKHRFPKFLGFILVFACIPLLGQKKDPLVLSHEVRLNERQPPEIVLEKIGIKPGMIIGEVGTGRGRYTVQIASRIGPSGKIYANDINQQALQFLKWRSTGLGHWRKHLSSSAFS